MPSIYDHLPAPEPLPTPTGGDRRPRVLIVDDQPVNVKLLERKLEREGMEPLVAENGRQCVDIARAEKPDLILLDVMMPEMDGIEACRILQSDPATREIPVIFVTARSGKDGKLEGLGAGAVDYIVKPVDLDETVARVRTQLRMREYHRENLALQARLAEARRQAMAGRITLGLSHNLNNLLGLVVGHLDLLRLSPGDASRVNRSVAGMDKGLRRMGDIISQVLLLGENGRPVLHRALPERIVRDAVETFRLERDSTGEILVDASAVSEMWIRTNAATIEVALARLLHNAVESAERVPGNEPRLRIVVTPGGTPSERRVIIRIFDNGRGVDAGLSENIFDPFISLKADVGSGLGLPLARHAVELLGGTLAIESLPEGGAVASVSLPVLLDTPAPFVTK